MNKYPFKTLNDVNKHIKLHTNRLYHAVVSSTNVIHFTKAISSDEVDVFKLQTSGITYLNIDDVNPVIEWLNN